MVPKIYSYEYFLKEAMKLCQIFRNPNNSIEMCQKALTFFIHLYFETLKSTENVITHKNEKCNNIMGLIFYNFEKTCVNKILSSNGDTHEKNKVYPIDATLITPDYHSHSLPEKA